MKIFHDEGIAEEGLQEFTRRIDRAVSYLDPYNDAHWNDKGLPNLKAIEALIFQKIRFARNRFPSLMLTRDYWAIEHGEKKNSN